MELLEMKRAEIPRIHTPRSPGLHLSDIIHDIANTSGISNYKRDTGVTLRMEMGFLWEEVLTLALKERIPCRMEIKQDGIYMSPDGIDVPSWELHEYKATWSSSNKSPLDNWRWMTQVKSYCYGTGTEICNLHVFYVNGDYKGTGPEYLTYRIRFTPMELQENWGMVLSHARSKGWIP